VKKTLYILVEDAAYSQHLRYYIEPLLDLIASEPICGENKVLKIRFRVGKLPEKTAVFPPQQLITPPQPAAKIPEPEKVTITAAKIQDQDLRNIFSSYMNKIIKREKEKNVST